MQTYSTFTLTLLAFQGDFVNDVPIRELVSILAKILQVIEHTINYGPICEWASIFAKILQAKEAIYANLKFLCVDFVEDEPICERHLYLPKYYG